MSSFGYDAFGNMISKTDKENRTTTYAYDGLNRLKTVTDPAGGVTSYVYDNRDNLINLTDAENNTTTFSYDRNNRLLTETRPGGQVTTYTYDDAGNLLSKTDAKDQRIEHTYDDAGRLTHTRYYEAGSSTPVKTVSFSYDSSGNLSGYDDGITQATYSYDVTGRKTGEAVDYGAFSKDVSYTYFSNGLKQTFTAPDGTIYTYSYDNANQLTGVQIPDHGYITYTGYTWNRPANMTLPGGATKQFTYDALMRITGITVSDPAQNALMGYSYSYDNMDNITAKNTEHGNYAYGYDDLYRLTSSDNPATDDEAYTYDKVGNRLSSEQTSGEWSYDDNNALNSYDDVSLEYDNNGNTITKSVGGAVVARYFYDVDNRLISVEDGSGSVIATYAYDPFGRRISKEVSGLTIYYAYADEGLVAEFDGNGNQTKEYGYRPGSTWTTDPLFMKQDGNYYFYQNDHLGTPQQLTSESGAVVWSAQYDAFGKATVDASSTVVNNLRFPGQYYDGETGMHYNWNRYYEPGVGRYNSVDPKGVQDLDGDINPYPYANGNPLSYVDPEGLFWQIVIPVVITGAIVYIFAKCYTDCAEANPCNDPTDPNRAAHLEKCKDRCFPFLNLLGWTSKGLPKKVVETIGKEIGEQVDNK